MVLGKVFVSLLGLMKINPAYAMNIFSAFSGAVAVLLLFLLIYELTGEVSASVLGGLFGGFAYMNWHLATVAEMYSLNLMFVVLILYLLKKRKYVLLAFTAGLAFGNRLDFLFTAAPV